MVRASWHSAERNPVISPPLARTISNLLFLPLNFLHSLHIDRFSHFNIEDLAENYIKVHHIIEERDELIEIE